MKRIVKLIATAVVILCAATSCGSDVPGSAAGDSASESVASSDPAVSSAPDSAAGTEGEEEFQCLLAQQDVTATFGMPAEARRDALKKVFSELPEPANERVQFYRSAVQQILDSENSDLASVDSLIC